MSEHIRTPSPFGRSRRRSILRAMPLSPIGDIASGGMTESTPSQTITWETATDWDNSVSEAGVVHEAFGDLPGDGVIQLGHPSFDRNGSALEFYYPLDESSGDAQEVSNNRDATVNGPTQGVSNGLWNSTRYSFGGGSLDSGVNPTAIDGPNLTASVWILPTDDGSGFQGVLGSYQISPQDGGFILNVDTGPNAAGLDGRVGNDTYYDIEGTTDVYDGNWHLITGVIRDTNEFEIWVDGTKEDSVSTVSNPDLSNDENLFIGTYQSGGPNTYSGDMDSPRVYSRALSSSEITALYDAGTGGNLETATKAFNSSSTPDLQNLVYSLNGDAIDLKVIGSPGTASEEIVTQSLDGSSSYTLTWSNSHTDFRLKPELSTTNVESTPTFSKGELIQ